MSLSTRLKATATRLLNKYGETTGAIVERITYSDFDPATGSPGIAGTSSFMAKAIAYPYVLSEIDGEIIQSNDLRLYLDTLNGKPLIGDTIEYDGSVYRVMNVEIIRAQSLDILYNCQVRL